MSNQLDDRYPGESEKVEGGLSHVEHAADLDEKSKPSDYKSDAIEAENDELNMGVLDAVRA